MTKNSVNALKLSPVTTILTDLLLAHLGLDDDVSVRGATPEVSLLDLGGDALGADAVHAVRTSAVVVELLPVVVEHHGGLDVGLTVLETFVDHLEHAVTLLVGLQQEDDLDLGPILALDRVHVDRDVRDRGDVAVVGLERLLLHHPPGHRSGWRLLTLRVVRRTLARTFVSRSRGLVFLNTGSFQWRT